MTAATDAAAPDSSDAWTLPELIARQLTSMHIIDGRLVQLVATPGSDYVALDVSHPYPPTSHMRVLLKLGEPVGFDENGVVDAEIVEDGAEIGSPA